MNYYKKYRSVKKLESIYEKLNDSLFDNYILYANQTKESREKSIKDTMMQVKERIAELKAKSLE